MSPRNHITLQGLHSAQLQRHVALLVLGTTLVLTGCLPQLATTTGSAPVPVALTGGLDLGGGPNGRLGAVLAVGDFNGDGSDDLAIGSPADTTGGPAAGQVHVLLGSPSGLRLPPALTLTGGQELGSGVGGSLGGTLAIGDFNGDGRDDLVIGSPGDDTGGENAGLIVLLKGTPTGLAPTPALTLVGGQQLGSGPRARLGAVLAVGDFNSDGRDDLALGSLFDNTGGPGAGLVAVLAGDAAGLVFPPVLTLVGGQALGSGAGGSLGTVLAVGDFNNVGGDQVEVVLAVPNGQNMHFFEPAATVLARLAGDADVFFVNGLNLEFAQRPLYESALAERPDLRVVNLASSVPMFRAQLEGLGRAEFRRSPLRPLNPAFDELFIGPVENVDPHAFLDPVNGIAYTETIRDVLSEIDPENASSYAANAERFIAEIQAVDQQIATLMDTIPPELRRIATTGEGFNYMAARYDISLEGELFDTLNLGVTTDPSPQALANVARQIRELGIPAIFREFTIDAAITEAVARAAGVTKIGTLSEVLLPSPEWDTYLEYLLANARVVVETLTGRPVS